MASFWSDNISSLVAGLYVFILNRFCLAGLCLRGWFLVFYSWYTLVMAAIYLQTRGLHILFRHVWALRGLVLAGARGFVFSFSWMFSARVLVSGFS